MDIDKFELRRAQQDCKPSERSPECLRAWVQACVFTWHALLFCCFPCVLAKAIMSFRSRSPVSPSDCTRVQPKAFQQFDVRCMPNVIRTVVVRIESHTREKTVKTHKHYTNVSLLLLLLGCSFQVIDCSPGREAMPVPGAELTP